MPLAQNILGTNNSTSGFKNHPDRVEKTRIKLCSLANLNLNTIEAKNLN